MTNEEILKQTKDALALAIQQKKANQDLLNNLGPAIIDTLRPVLDEIARNSKITKEDILQAVSSIKIDAPIVPKTQVDVTIPPINIPEVTIKNDPIIIPDIKTDGIVNAITKAFAKLKQPEIRVTIPEIKIPPYPSLPEYKPFDGQMTLKGVDAKYPLPVMMMGGDGKPYQFSTGSGGGGKADFFTIKGIQESAYGLLINGDGRLKVSVETGGSGLTDNELRAAHIDVLQLSGAIYSVYVTGFNASVAASLIDSSGIAYSGSNPVPVVFGASATQAVMQVDSTGVAYSGSNPVPVVFGASATQAVNIVDSSGVGYSGTNPIPVTGTVVVSSVTASTASALTDSSGVQYSGSNPVPITGNIGTVTTVTGVTNSLATANIDSSGVQYSGSNPFPYVLSASSATNTMNVAVTDSGGIQYSGSNPLPVTVMTVTGALTTVSGLNQVLTRQTNPTAIVSDWSPAGADDLGRTITRPIQVRDLLASAYVSATTGTEATLLAASAGNMFDLISVMCANQSDAATTIDIRGVLAGNVLLTVAVPANGTAGINLTTPWPQTSSDTGNAWTYDMPDITGTVVNISALFSKEV